ARRRAPTLRDETALVACRAPEAREAAAEQATVEVRLELLLGVLRHLDVERAIVDGPVERLEVIAHKLVERRRLRAVALVAGGAAVVGGGGRQAHAGAASRVSCRACGVTIGGISPDLALSKGWRPSASPWRS